MTKQEILDELKESGYEEDGTTGYNWDELDGIFSTIEQADGENLTLRVRSTDYDTWVQSEWYSQAIQKTVITDYDVCVGDTIGELVDTYLGLLKDAKELEKRLEQIK